MNPLLTLRIAMRALLRNKMRSFLTTLGIIIGVAAVIAMVAIGEGAKAQVEKAFAAMGTSLLIVMPGSSSSGGARGGFGSQPTLTWDDLKAIQTEVPSVRMAAPVLRSSAQLVSEDQNWTTQVQGTTPEYFEIRNWNVANGTNITQSDVDGGTKVIVIGLTVAKQLFGAAADPVGQVVRIKNTPYQVIGVLAAKGQSPTGQDYRSREGYKSFSPARSSSAPSPRTTRHARRTPSPTFCAIATTSGRAPTTTSRSATSPRSPVRRRREPRR